MEGEGVEKFVSEDKGIQCALGGDLVNCVIPIDTPSVFASKITKLCFLRPAHSFTGLYKANLLHRSPSGRKLCEYLKEDDLVRQRKNTRKRQGRYVLAAHRA